MKTSLFLLIILLLAGCAPASVKPTYFDGQSATYQHHKYHFRLAMADAQKQCTSVNKLVKHDRTDCQQNISICISTFSCIVKK